ncbi:MAG: EAL domain-containing protein [Thioalkalispiraceae bacterium]|jgi:diguanylate cyclase (GGDEF)-like protein
MTTRFIKVLLVEDNPGDARLVREMFSDIGANEFILTHVNSLDEALNQLDKDQFDVMLLDLSLPDAQGLEAVKHILDEFPKQALVVLSGMNDSNLAIEAVKFGAQDYLVKGEGDGNLLTRSLRYAIERKRSEERLAYLAQYDPLTGLPNRSLFQDRMQAAMRHAERNHNIVVLMFLDLDHFKDINDSLGHNAGDMLLKDVAKRLHGCIRNEDTIARLGGDEFTIILQNIDHREDAASIASKIIDVLSAPFLLYDEEVFVTTSIGIASYPSCGNNVETVMQNADTALYRAKSEGRNNYQFFETEMNSEVSERMTMINDLRRAVQNNEFTLYYQPLVEAETDEVIGMEALLRWQYPKQGLLPAKEFISLLEETGLIVPVGEWILHEACRQIRLWQQAGLPPLCISVNLSVRQFHKYDLLKTVTNALNENQIDPKLLQLEVTETILMDHSGGTLKILEQLHQLGVHLAIDDFGTGYSSLSYLKKYPFDLLKFDRSFVEEMNTSANGAAIVAAVINLGHSINMSVMAEGVETQQQLSLLLDRNCDQFQGYLFAPPMSADSCTKWLQEKANKLMPSKA